MADELGPADDHAAPPVARLWHGGVPDLCVGDSSGVDQAAFAFAIGYLLVVVVHSGLYAETHGASVWRFVPMNVLGAACLVGAAFVDGWVRYGLWAATLALHYATARLAGRVSESQGAGYAVRADHFVERHGLALAAALWWVYFITDPARSEEALVAAPLATRVHLALAGYFYAFIPILFGIVVLAAGLGRALRHIEAPLSLEYAILLGAGTALYLLGTMAFRLVFGIQPVATRLAAAAVAGATAIAGVTVSALLQVGLLIATVVELIAVESRAGAHSGT